MIRRNSDLRYAFKFFLENAGYATPPGRAKCAWDLARAERWWKRQRGADVIWDEDYGGYLNDTLGEHEYWCRKAKKGEECTHEILTCGLFLDGGCVASLCGIIDPDKNYRRVVEAELALEFMEGK